MSIPSGLEAVLKLKFLVHLSQLSLLATRQHGFHSRRSTVTNRLFVEGSTVDIVYLYFVKAFDSVNHRLILIKVRCYGIAPSVLNWIEPFLQRRSFQVSINGSLSQVEPLEVQYRVPSFLPFVYLLDRQYCWMFCHNCKAS